MIRSFMIVLGGAVLGLAACGGADSGSADQALCAGADFVDGGAYSPDALAALDAEAADLPAPSVDTSSSGCTVKAYGADGTLLQEDVLDTAGRPTDRTLFGPEGAVTSQTVFAYDGGEEVRRNTTLADGGGAEVTWTFTNDGAIDTFHDPSGHDFNWSYGSNGEVLGWTETGVRQVTYHYDGGVPVSYTSDDDAIGETFGYAVDGTLAERHFDTPDSTRTLSYDGQGRITSAGLGGAHFGSTSETFGYDTNGCLLTKETTTVGSPHDVAIAERWQRESDCRIRIFGNTLLSGVSAEAPFVLRRAFDGSGAVVLEELDRNGDCQSDGRHLLLRDAQDVLREEQFEGALLAVVAKRTFEGAGCPAFPDGSPYPLPDPVTRVFAPFPTDWDLFWKLPLF